VIVTAANQSSIDGFAVVTSHPDLVKYVDHLQRKNAEALSFYPITVFEREQSMGRIFLGLLNGQPAGYIYVGSGRDRVVRCHQVCIEYDARRRLYGAALVNALEQYASKLLATRVRLRCGFDLDANSFWQSMGYHCVDVQQGGVRRMRKINVWEKLIAPELFGLQAIEPAVGKVDASLWRKGKRTGTVTQFVRGKKMQDYRALIVGNTDDSDSA
jgi:GNAT superfamily N-acetyltransferase